jgi:hypothetical protein
VLKNVKGTILKLLVSALEPSANLHLEPILNALEKCELYGIFDERFGKPLMPSRAFSIMGFLDALPKIRKAKKAIKIMARMSFFVDKVLLIDSPAFNLPLAKAIKTINPNVEIGWDGGVNVDNAYTLTQGGVDVLNVGGAIANAAEPGQVYATLVSEINKHGVI